MIYLDYNATTPVDEQVLDAMLPYFSQKFGNAASATHVYGMQAKQAVDAARHSIAKQINSSPEEITFTSGSTEAINLAIKGVWNLYQNKGKHIITVKTEHNAVLDTCHFLSGKGALVTYLDVDANGLIDLNQLESAITPQTVLVAVMYANNETGVVQPVREIADIIHQKNSIFFCDATQAIGKIPVDVDKDGIDMLCISGHKIYAPKGVGCLYTRRKNPRVSLEPLIHGGGHEQGKRSGTLNVPGIVALGKAVELFAFDISLEKLRNEFEFSLMQHFGNLIQINGKNAPRIPNTSNIEFPFKAADFIRQTKTKLAVSTGSACTSAENKPSHVLTAMGLSKENAERCIRFSLGKYTTPADIQSTIEIIKQIQVMKYD